MPKPSWLERFLTLRLVVRDIRRIADALERAYPPPRPTPLFTKPLTADALTQYDPIADYEAELEEERQRNL